MRTEEEIQKQIEICEIDMENNDYHDIRHVMARSELRVLRWFLGYIDEL